ncbi:hypothetical protein LX32DRAFT_645573, partial [Colletotrichum zoysiae]
MKVQLIRGLTNNCPDTPEAVLAPNRLCFFSMPITTCGHYNARFYFTNQVVGCYLISSRCGNAGLQQPLRPRVVGVADPTRQMVDG